MTRQMSKPHLFTVRVWLEESEDGQYDCRGRLQHGLDGTAQHFQGWSALIDLMSDMVHEPGRAASADESGFDSDET